jgi:hypothetical protein
MPGHYYVRRLDELPSVPDPEPGDPDGRPVRHYFGIESFGVNAFVATVGDEEIVVEHDEVSGNAQGHQELYYLARGRARFSLDGDELDIDEGTFVACPDPTVRRGAVALEPGTVVLAIGAPAGRAFAPTPWERKWTPRVRPAADEPLDRT